MKVSEVMSRSPFYCTAETSLKAVAVMMLERNCGAIPVFDNTVRRNPVGMITDRDITIRIVAQGRDPKHCTVQDAMTPSAIVIGVSEDVTDAARVMRQNGIHRVAVVEPSGACIGVLTLSDIVQVLPGAQGAKVLRQISIQRHDIRDRPARRHNEAALDEALDETFPASDPVSISPAGRRSAAGKTDT